MQRRHVLLGVGAAASGSAVIGTGAFSRVESHRSVSVQVAEDSDAYLGLQPADTPNGQNYAESDDNGHLEIDIGENPNDGEGINTNSVTWFDCVFEVRNQGKEDAGFFIDDETEGLGTDEGEIDFYVGEAADQGDSGITSIVGLPVELELESGEAVCVGIRANSPEEDVDFDEALFEDDIKLVADVDVEGSDLDGSETVFNTTQNLAYNTIQDAVDEADEDDTIEVEPGTYTESVTIDVEGLTLEGPNAGIDGDSDDRSDEATITDGVRWTNQDNLTVDGFEVEREVGDGDGVFELGQGFDSRIGENAVIKNNVIRADPVEDPGGNEALQGVLYESNADTGSGDEADDDELFIENNLLEQKDGERVDAVNSNESDIDTLVITDNAFNIGLITLSDGEFATITDNEFTEEAPLGVAFFGGGADIEENSFETQGIWTLGSAAVNVDDNDFNADEDTDHYVRDSADTLNLEDILNEQGNTFDPDGNVGTFDGDDAIVPSGNGD